MQDALLFLFIILIIVSLSAIEKKQLSDDEKWGITAPLNTTAYRGFAMLIIIIAHICGNWGTIIYTPFGGIGVAIFLFLSGYGLSESNKKSGLTNFLQKKLLRIVLPYALFRIVCVMVQGNFKWYPFILDILCWESAYWYIDYMVRCYIVFWIANSYFSRYKFIVFALFALYTFFEMDAIRAEQALSFFMGVLCSTNIRYINSWSKKRLKIIMITMGILGISCLAVKQQPAIRALIDTYCYYFVELGIKLPLGIASMIMLFLLPIGVRKSPILTFFGVYSLELYLVHMSLLTSFVYASIFQGIAMLIISMLIAYSFHKAINTLLDYLRIHY